MLREMPPVPLPAPEEPAPPEDDIMAARWEVEAELKAQEAPFLRRWQPTGLKLWCFQMFGRMNILNYLELMRP